MKSEERNFNDWNNKNVTAKLNLHSSQTYKNKIILKAQIWQEVEFV